MVFFLHGFLQVAPQIYLDAIKHLTVMLQRAIDNARKGLAIAGRRVRRR